MSGRSVVGGMVGRGRLGKVGARHSLPPLGELPSRHKRPVLPACTASAWVTRPAGGGMEAGRGSLHTGGLVRVPPAMQHHAEHYIS